jgi:glycosyltransferase involved in cell wall biosynthesis
VRRSDAVIVNGQAGARYVQRLGARPPRIFQIPYTTDLRPLVTLPIARPPHVRKRLLYCGALSERKGVRQFVEALARWAASHPSQTVKLDVVGHGPLSGFLETFHGPSNLELELRGAIHYSDLPDIYRHAGICVFPTLADEWGMVVTEAMAAGLPVMGSPYSQAVEELVRDRANGWTFRPDQSAEIDRALEQALMSSDQELEAMGRNARETVRPMTPAYVASQVMAVAALIREGGER